MRITRVNFGIGLALLLVSWPVLLLAQTAGTGALSGTVTDATGAVMAGVEVNVTSEATGEVRSVASAANGNYSVPLLLPGLYRVQVSKTGFKISEYEHLRIAVTETATLNVKLEIGQATETVTVEANAEVLQTESSTLGRVTTGEQIRSLPLVTRNFTQIISLNPGVAADVNNASDLGSGNKGSGGAPVVSNGVSRNDNNVQLNGAAINDLQSSGTFSGGVAIPNPDSIQEFKVQTGQYDATYGRNAGANVNLVTKGGSNNFHGAAWEFLRNEDLNANSFFRNQLGQPRPVLKQNQFGGDFGGPIKKDKLFFFTSYQGTRQRNGLDGRCSSRVASPPLTDDRSAAALGALFGGRTGAFGPGAGGANTVKADGSNINPVSLALLQLKLPNGNFVIPTPQTVDPSRSPDGQGISEFSFACPFTEDQFLANGDWLISDKSKLEERFFFANSGIVATLPGSPFGNSTVPGFPVNNDNNYRNFTLKHTYIFSPSVVNEATLGFHRTVGLTTQSNNALSYSQIGATVPGFDTLPLIWPDASTPNAINIGGNGQTLQIFLNNYNFQDSLSWTKGRHTLRFGGGVAREQLNYREDGAFFAWEAYLTFPDFLLGLNGAQNGTGVSNVFLSVDEPGSFGRAYRVLEANAYAQDDIKLTSRLTVNLGLRYDRLGDLADAKGRNASFDTSLANPKPPSFANGGTLAGTTVPANFPGAIPTGVTQLNNNYGIRGDGQNTLNPRVGFAWRLPRTERFVLRGGYGVYHSRSTGQPFIGQLFAPPFGRQRIDVLTANATAQTPFDLNVPAFPSFASASYASDTVTSRFVFAPNFRPPIVQEYSLGVQTALTKTLLLETAYSGARGLHLIRQGSVNQAQLASLTNPIVGRFGQQVTKNTVGNVQDRVPFQGFRANGLTNIQSNAASWYNALLVSLNKRFSHGLQLQGSYTFAKNLSNAVISTTGFNGGVSVGDQNNLRAAYGPDAFTRTHRLIVNYIYELPGPHNRHSLAGQTLGGWSVSGIATFQSGQHDLVFFNNTNNVFGITNDRASLSGTCKPGQYVTGGLDHYINASCFVPPAVFNPADSLIATGFGNSGVGIFDGPGQHNWDIAVIKKFAFHWPRDGAGLEFRTEFFNAFNHPQFADPSLSCTIKTGLATCDPATLGQITDTTVAPRIIQFALKFNF